MSYYSSSNSYKVYDYDVYSYFNDFDIDKARYKDLELEENFVNEKSPRFKPLYSPPIPPIINGINNNNNNKSTEYGCYTNTTGIDINIITTENTNICYVNSNENNPEQDTYTLDPKNNNNNSSNNNNKTNNSNNNPFLSVSGSGSSIDIVSQLNRYTTRDFKRKDWNSEFQNILSLPNSEQKFSKLSHLARDFVFTAKSYAQIIINELCVPIEQKTIKPIDVGGFAGGLKYHCHNILFKFAMDTMLGKECWMYGGKAARDDYAAKAASNELKGLTSYYTAGIEGLNYPLMALIDYKGFRLIALSVLPISSETIRYGSSDSGAIVHSSIEELNQKMTEAGRKLNLKPHRVGSIPDYTKVLASPGDIEAHLGTDNRYYVIDFSRTFPPESLTKQPNINKRCIFYNLLRPEFVSKWKKPLCSDSFSGWQRFDVDKALHNKEVEEATNYLVNTQVKFLANKFDGSESFKSKYERDNSLANSSIIISNGTNNNNNNTNNNNGNNNDINKKTKIIQGPSDFNQIKSTFATKFFPIFSKRYMESDLPLPPSIIVREDTKLINSSLDSTSSNGSNINNNNNNSNNNNSNNTNQNSNSNTNQNKISTRPMIQVKNDVQQQLLKVIEEIHRLGINIRHMGRIRYYTKTKTIRDLLLLEMTARSIKTIIRDEMRKTMKDEQGLSEEPFKQIIIQILNLVLDSDSPVWRRVYENIKTKYYMSFMKFDEKNEINIKLSTSTTTMLSKLTIVDDASSNTNNGGTNSINSNSNNSSPLSPSPPVTGEESNFSIQATEEYTIDDNWKENINIKSLLERVFILTGISLSSVAQSEFSKDPYRFQFVDSDIQEIYANVKHMNIIDYAEGMALSMASKSKQGREKLRLLKMSSLKFQTSLKSNPDNFECLCQLGRTLVSQAEAISATTGIFGKNIFLKTLEDAVFKFQYALTISPTYSKAYYELAHVHILIANHLHNTFKKAQQNYTEAATNFKKSIENSINIFSLLNNNNTNNSGNIQNNNNLIQIDFKNQIFQDLEKLYLVSEEGNYPSYMLGVSIICKELNNIFKDNYQFLLLYGKSLVFKPGYDEDTDKEYYYSEAAGKFYNAIQLEPGCIEQVYELCHDLWIKSKVGNRKLYYPTYCILRLLVRNNIINNDNKVYSMYSDSMFELIKMDSSNSGIYLEELSDLFNQLIKRDSNYFNDRLQNALENQLIEITNFIKIAHYSPKVLEKLKLKVKNSQINNNNNIKWNSLNLEKTLISNQDLKTIGEIYTNLEELNLSSCPMVNDQQLSEFLSNHGRSIHVLLLSDTLIADKTISVIANYCNSLVHLNIQNCPFIDPESLCQLYKLPKLRKLDLSKCKLTNEVVSTLSNTPLVELYIRYQRINDSSFKLFQSPWSTLKILDLSSCSMLTDNSFTAIPNCPSMEQLILEACYNLTDQSVISIANHMPKLTKLGLKGCKLINDSSITYLVSRCQMIKDLKLSRCQRLTGESIKSITEFLSPVLERIDISMCPNIYDQSIQPLIESAKSLLAINLSEIPSISDSLVELIVEKHPNLQHLRLDKCGLVTFSNVNFQNQSSSLLTLSLKKSQIFNQSFLKITTTLFKLTHLTLHACLQLTDQSFSSISNLTSLEYLDLSGNTVLHDTSMVLISKSLLELKTLDASMCPRITAKSFQSIGKYQTKLESLNLSGCDNLNDNSLIYILEHLLNLTQLHLTSCLGITDRSIDCLARNQIQLETVTLTDCRNIRLAAVDQLKVNCPLFRLAKVSVQYHTIPSQMPKEILKPIPYQENQHTLDWKIKSREKALREQEEKEKAEEEKKIEIQYQPFIEKVPYSELCFNKNEKLNPLHLEKYLTDKEFLLKLKMSPDDFDQLPKWKKDKLKKNLSLF